MANNKSEHIRGALAAAENSIKLARQLLAEMEGGRAERPSQPYHQPVPTIPVPDRPGVVGVYDGEKMTTADGQVFVIPGNYASKSLLVVGDTLKMYEENGEKRFKQIEHVKRHKTTGLLVKKEGKFRAITPEGSYKVLTESINHFNGEVGDEVILHLPAGNLTSPYAAIETIHKKTKTEQVEAAVQEQPRVQEVAPVEKKPLEVPKPRKEAPKPPKAVEKKVALPKALVTEPVALKVVEKKAEEKVEEKAPVVAVETPSEPVSAADEELS